MLKSQLIRELLQDGVAQAKIAKVIGCSRQYVHQLSKAKPKEDWRLDFENALAKEGENFLALSIEALRKRYAPEVSYQVFWSRYRKFCKERAFNYCPCPPLA
ncbi:MAG: hypothetical protein HC919_15040 [Oscillatoriales cyanobacterium SM2_2_1]|nr:hypothetical protein [Oscillatoriales cyanobacterium SM2_2_1]